MFFTVNDTSICSALPLYIYFISYFVIIVSMAVLIWSSEDSLDNINLPLAFSKLNTFNLFKFFLIVSLLTVAGIPPFFFFLAKLSVLSPLMSIGLPGVFTSLIMFLLITWYAYYSILIKLLEAQHAFSNVNNLDIWHNTVIIFVLLFLFSFGIFFIEEFFFLSSTFRA